MSRVKNELQNVALGKGFHPKIQSSSVNIIAWNLHKHYLLLSTMRLQYTTLHYTLSFIHSLNILSDDRSKASSKTIPPHSAI